MSLPANKLKWSACVIFYSTYLVWYSCDKLWEVFCLYIKEGFKNMRISYFLKPLWAYSGCWYNAVVIEKKQLQGFDMKDCLFAQEFGQAIVWLTCPCGSRKWRFCSIFHVFGQTIMRGGGQAYQNLNIKFYPTFWLICIFDLEFVVLK